MIIKETVSDKLGAAVVDLAVRGFLKIEEVPFTPWNAYYRARCCRSYPSLRYWVFLRKWGALAVLESQCSVWLMRFGIRFRKVQLVSWMDSEKLPPYPPV